MMQRTIGMYIANKVKDEIFSPEEVETEDGQVAYVQPESDPLDGELIRDDEGRALGRAYRVPNVACYVVGAAGANPDRALERALNDPETQTIIHWENDQIAALVFVPSRVNDEATGLRGFRADDV